MINAIFQYFYLFLPQLSATVFSVGLALSASQAIAEEPVLIINMTKHFQYKPAHMLAGNVVQTEVEPARVTIKVGDTVEWRNTSDEPHTVVLDPQQAANQDHVRLPEGAKTFDSGNIQPSDSFRYTFTTLGEYRYFCKLHEALGMIGELTVNPAE